MNDNFSLQQSFRKATVSSEKGIVSAQHRRAAEVGARILAKGGDCMDAAVAVSFALGALEPWMSGIGGIGTMVLYRASDQRFEVIDFGGSAPAGLKPEDYPLMGDGTVSDLFPWKRVKDDRNIHGAGAVAIPGVVAGMGEAHKRYGKLAWQELVTPAAQLAAEGLLVDWFTTENIAVAAADLRKYPTAAAEFLVDGLPPVAQWAIKSEVRLPRPRYGKTLAWIAEHGSQAFYQGALAKNIALELESAGGPMRASDLASYKVRVTKSLAIPYRSAVVHVSPELTAGPTLAQTLKQLSAWVPNSSAPDAQSYLAYSHALQAAYQQRLSDMGDAEGKRAIGAEHLLSRADQLSPNCTSHFNVVDAQGNMVAVTQTLLGIFGSKFVTPQSGVLMNNGIMWFDPEPGRTNSLAGGKRALCNYTPVIAQIGPNKMMAVGASGGRRILPAVAQMLSFAIDYGMDLESAFHSPRVDASEGATIIGDARLDQPVHALLGKTFDYEQARLQTLPMKFACPSAVMRQAGRNSGGAEVFQPWADAVVGE